ncbi:MAG: tyrosine-type recombinase/integrase [Nitrospina sp.]|nr:tyrosine-type recombinase/integrase [Nitrospina sp.]
MRFRGERGCVVKSLWTKDKEEATRGAEQIYDELNYKLTKGLSINGRKFNKVCNQYLSHIQEQVELGKAKEKKLKDYTLICERYLKNYFGKKDIDKISDADLNAYRDWRNAYWITGDGKKIEHIKYVKNGKVVKSKARHKVPSSSTMNTEETVLRGIFEHGIKKGFIGRGEIPNIKSERVRSNRRPSFTLEEYRILRVVSRARCRKGPSEAIKRKRLILHEFVLVMANTGMRPIEAKTLRWQDIGSHISADNGRKHVVLSVRGKDKKRDLIAQPATDTYLKRIRERQDAYAEEHGYKIKKDDFIFSDEYGNQINSFKAGFDNLLKEANLVEDNHGLKRCVYSLRHLYGTFRLVYGNVDVFFLAENMGTSVDMIKRHYSHLKVTQVADHLTRLVNRKS